MDTFHSNYAQIIHTKRLSVALDEELSPLDERLETLQRAIREKLAVLEPDLPPLPEPEANPKDEGWLFDSRRDYREQLCHYKDRSV